MATDKHAALLERNLQVPRYTSYPTAPHFHGGITARTMQDWLAALPETKPLSLYFHIPFCQKLCWYCGCNTKATQQYAPVQKYLSYLKEEVSLVAKALGSTRDVSHIHFGGGSPSYLSAGDFTDFMLFLHEHFNIDKTCEIAIELDPREITETKVAAYSQAGVNRVSLGVQDFHKNVQQAINRVQPLYLVYDSIKLLRHYNITQVNMDLLYGLPHQTKDSILQNIDIAAGLAPSRISLFGYAHVPWLKKHMRLIDEQTLPDGKKRLEQFDAAQQALCEKGYQQIGLDHFVQPNDTMATACQNKQLHRNFQGYTTDAADTLIGFGPSAISVLPQGYAQNTPNNNDYFKAVEAQQLPIIKGIETTAEDRMRRALISDLMCYLELDLLKFCDDHNLDIQKFEHLYESLNKLADDSLISFDAYLIKIHKDATQAVRLVCTLFDEYFQASRARHAQVA